MQPLIADVFVSVDGWAGSAGSPGYFGYYGTELGDWIRTELERPQLALLGRRTYEALAALPEEAQDESWRRTSELDKVVFSRTLDDARWPNTKICRAEPLVEVQRLKSIADRPLRTLGSLSIVRQLLRAGLVDTLRLMTFPLLLGSSGRESLFADGPTTELELLDHRVLDGRILLVEYRPTGHPVPSA